MPKKAEEVKPIKKTAVKKAKKEVVESEVKVSKGTPSAKGISVKVYGVDGKESGSMSLPAEIFAAKINAPLMAQAVRVYLANQRQGTSSTKTRGEVAGSTRKIYRQKGTGRARHGGIRAPIFVHGGIAFGPKPRDLSLSMPPKMKRKALFSALTTKFGENKVMIADLQGKIEGKTKTALSMLNAMNVMDKKKKTNNVLVVIDKESQGVLQASRNIEGVTVMFAPNINTYEVLKNNYVLFLKNAVDTLESVLLKDSK